MTSATDETIAKRARLLERLFGMGGVLAKLRGEVEVCGATPREAGQPVTLRRRRGARAIFGRVHECGRTRTCPSCSRSRFRERRRDSADLMHNNCLLGGDSVMVSLSIGFPDHWGFFKRWQVLRDMLTRLRKNDRARAARNALGYHGYIKRVHLLVSPRGWHAHAHLVYVFEGQVTQDQADELAHLECEVWKKLARKAGCDALPSNQLYTRIDPAKDHYDRVAKYLTKDLEEIEFGEPANKEDFWCAEDHHGNKSPWHLLYAAAFKGDVLTLAPLAEWIKVVDNEGEEKFQLNHLSRDLLERQWEEVAAKGLRDAADVAERRAA